MRDSSQLPTLILAKLKSFAVELDKDDDYEERVFPSGAILFNSSRLIAYSLSDEVSALPVVLAQKELTSEMEIHLVVDQENPVLSAQIRGFDLDISLWLVEGKKLVEHPETPTYRKKTAPEGARELVKKLTSLECCILEEHGTFRAEFRGVEVARITEEENGHFKINVGIGDYDQNAHNLLFHQENLDDRIKEVISMIKKLRHKESPPHPLNRILRSRWLMSEVISNPELIGMEELNFVESLLPEYDALRNEPCAAIGVRDNAVILVLSATGVDLDLVPHSGGQLGRHNPDELLLLMPEQDQHPVILRQSRHLRTAPSFRSIPTPWPEFLQNK
tara:strand:- start:330 stop:1328 length:999 start_codon:yes stop_codon:yes gene_type:complete